MTVLYSYTSICIHCWVYYLLCPMSAERLSCFPSSHICCRLRAPAACLCALFTWAQCPPLRLALVPVRTLYLCASILTTYTLQRVLFRFMEHLMFFFSPCSREIVPDGGHPEGPGGKLGAQGIRGVRTESKDSHVSRHIACIGHNIL